jgi:two-component system NtrC family sensor kinase
MFYFLIILLGSIFIRKRFDFAIKQPQLDGFLKLSWVVSLFILLSKSYFLGSLGMNITAALFILMAFVLYCYWVVKDEQKPDAIVWSTLGFIVVSIIIDLSEAYSHSLYDDYSGYLNLAQLGSFVSILAFGIGISNQQKALDKEKEKSVLISKQKDELEELVVQRTSKITEQKEELLQTLKELKSTQSQLIQSEKLASLGELTAGIAHEIQNPLNFVNNFSELSKELIDELKEERTKDTKERDIGLEDEILKDIETNLEKINAHGNRASSIVKNMLEHSRSSKGIKEKVDINKLADEYLRLSYHGLRAKDKSFNADFEIILDDKIPMFEVVPQDFGRVLLNIINNAFYSVKEKSKKQLEDYKPKVTIHTKYQPTSKTIKISIKDNGSGISVKNKNKIFQPFFTTKPAGEGTGLGLSLSHEIIKAHGGEIELKTKLKEGTEFIITLPQK